MLFLSTYYRVGGQSRRGRHFPPDLKFQETPAFVAVKCGLNSLCLQSKAGLASLKKTHSSAEMAHNRTGPSKCNNGRPCCSAQSRHSGVFCVTGAQLSIWQCFPGLRSDSELTQHGLWFLSARTTKLDPPKDRPCGLDCRAILESEAHTEEI